MRGSVKAHQGSGPVGSSLTIGFQVYSLSAVIHIWVQALQNNLIFSGVFLPFFSMLIFSRFFLAVGSKCTSLCPGFCVNRSRQYDANSWGLNLSFGFFVFFWLLVWGNEINKCGWCLAGGRGCWQKGLHKTLF